MDLEHSELAPIIFAAIFIIAVGLALKFKLTGARSVFNK